MLYFVHSSEGRIKIGWTGGTMNERIRNMKKESRGCTLRLLAATHGNRDRERNLHNRFSHLRIEGEWYTDSQEIYNYIETLDTVPEGTKDAEPLNLRLIVQRLGKQIRNARLRRRLKTQDVAYRASISRGTLGKIEHGNSDVSLMNYLRVLQVLGLEREVLKVAEFDQLGIDLASDELPQRVRKSPSADE